MLNPSKTLAYKGVAFQTFKKKRTGKETGKGTSKETSKNSR